MSLVNAITPLRQQDSVYQHPGKPMELPMIATASITPNNTKPVVSTTATLRNNPIDPTSARLLARAMHNPDEWVIRLRYRGKNGLTTERVISPIKMISPTAILALCLCREDPRRFELERCSHIELVNANDVLMPVAIRVIPADSVSVNATSQPIALTATA